MGSNSLLEGIVLGMRAGALAATEANGFDVYSMVQCRTRELPRPPAGVRVNLEDIIYSLKSLMWRQMGVERTQAGIEDALSKIGFWSRAVSDLGAVEPRAWELMNMLTVSRLATLCAVARQESRGVHYRSDFPVSRADWRVHSLLTPEFGGDRLTSVVLRHEPVRDHAPVS
jgi:L-aspartate oxidase